MASRQGKGAQQVVRPAALGGHFAAIEHLQCLLLRVPVEKEAATRQPGALGFDDGQHRLGADQGIGRSATLCENLKGCCAGQRIGAHDNRRPSRCGDALAAGVGGFRVVAADRCCCSGSSPAAKTQDQKQETAHSLEATRLINRAAPY